MRTQLDCLPCMIRQALDAARRITGDPETHEEVLRRSMRLISSMDLKSSPPALAVPLYALVNEITGVSDPYEEIKKRYNDLLLSRYAELKHCIATAADRFETAIRIAIAGNIIDFGHASALHEGIDESIESALTSDIDEKRLNELRHEIETAERILYLGDNAGEIVLDRLFIEELPTDRVTFVVRDQPIINDITMADARYVGMDKVVRVITNGSGTPGVDFDHCSDEFREAYETADLIISKGQGNYETLNLETANIFFLLKVKCGLVAGQLRLPLGATVIARTQRSAEGSSTCRSYA